MRHASVFRAARRPLCLLLVLIMVLPVLGGSETPYGTLGALPLGASTSAPEQRTGTADGSSHAVSGDATRANAKLPQRDQPRPAGAVPDHAPALPEVKQASHQQGKVNPKVSQPRDAEAIDPNAKERPGDRTATTQTFDNPDGSRTLRLHTGQANVRQPDGSWKPVDLDLVPVDGRLKPEASPIEMTLATTGSDGSLVNAGLGNDRRLSYGLADAANVRGEVHGAQVTYRGVRPGVDVRLTATSTGVKEDLVLASAATSSFAFTLALDRLQPRLTDTGDLELVDGEDVVAVMPAAFMDDAAGVRSTDARYSLDKTGDRTWTLRLALGQAWLNDPARVFPVVVDPSVATPNADSDDTFVRSSAADQSGAPELEAGRVQGQPIARSYLRFGSALNTLRNQYIVGASLVMYNVWSPSCTPKGVTVFEVTQGWNGSTRWPGAAVGQALSSKSFAHGAPGCGSAREAFPLDADLMTRWTHGAALGNGLSVRASDESDAGSGKRFASANSPNPPYLDVRYSPEGASFDVTDVLLPTNAHAGNLTAKVTNLGQSAWNSGGGTHFGYIVKQGNTVIRTRNGFRANVAPMQTHTFAEIPIDPLAPGDYQLYLTMFTPEGANFQDVHGVPFGRVDVKVSNVPPSTDYQQPGSGAVVESLTPTLYAEGVDADNWPGKGFTYNFKICTNQQLTENCQESGWTGQSWAPSASGAQALRWSKTYYWSVKVHDTVDESLRWVGPLVLSTRVPQPQITSHLAGSPNSTEGPGLDPGIGNYSTVVTDASVGTVGPDLTVSRTYNSLDPRRDTAFGVGWASRLDMRLKQDDDGSRNVVVTYPSGRQIRFGRNADSSFGSPLGDSTELVYDAAGGVYTLRDNTGGKWRFDELGRLTEIVDPAGLTEQFGYDTEDRVTTITNGTSGRTLTLTWQGKRVSTVTTQAPAAGVAPLVWTYTYDGEKLTKACVPGDAPNCTTYGYTTGSRYRSSVVDDNPKAYWRLGETSGATFANAVARKDGENSGAQHGVVPGTAGALGGTADKAATFDGNSSYVTLPEKLTNETMSLAVELWFKTTTHGTLISYSDNGFPNSAGKSTPLLYVGTDGVLYGGFAKRDSGGPRQIVSADEVNDGHWHHALLSGAIDSQTLYLDGRKVGENLTGLIDHRQQKNLTLGAGYAKGFPATNDENFYFNGSIDEVAVYQHSVGSLAAAQHFASRTEIAQLDTITLPQDDRRFAKLTYDDINDRVKTLVDDDGRTWSLDTPRVQDAVRTAVVRGPSNYGDWTYTYDIDNGGRLTARTHDGVSRKFEYNTKGFMSASVDEIGLRTELTTDDRGNVLSRKTCRAPGSCNTSYSTYVQSPNPLDPRRDKLESTSDARSADANDTRFRTSYTYDSAGRKTRTTFPVPDGQIGAPTEINTYASGDEDAVGGGKVPAGLLIKTTGKRDQVTRFSYRANGDLAEATTPTGLRTSFGNDAIGRRTSVTQANAGGAVFGTTTTEYTPRSQVAKVTEPAVTNPITGLRHQKVTTYRYDGNGNVLESTISDALPTTSGGDRPRTTVMTYDAQDRVVQTQFPDGGKEVREYLDNGLTQVLTDVQGIKWTSQSDENGRLQARSASGTGVDPEDPGSTGLVVESNVYDDAGRLKQTQDAQGRTTSYLYYDDGLKAKTVREHYTAPNGQVQNVVLEDWSYDPAGHPTALVSPGGIKNVQTYDAAGFLTSTTLDPEGLARSTTYRRDADGNAVRVETRGAADPNRTEVAAYVYDGVNKVTREEAFLDANTTFSTTYDRDERGLVRSQTDRRQLTTDYTYDATGQVVTATLPATDIWVNGTQTQRFRRVETTGHNAFGEQSHSKAGDGAVTVFERDDMGRVVKTALPGYTPPGGQIIRPVLLAEYDHAGRTTKMTDALGRVTTHQYDPYGHLLKTTVPQVDTTPSSVSVAYSRAGEVLTRTDPTGAQTRFTYDELGRQITSTAVERSSGTPVFFTTTTTYDASGKPVEQTGPTGAVTRKTFNTAGDVLTLTDPTNRVTTNTFDITGRLATTADPAGVVTALTYDLLGRQTKTAQLVGGAEKRAATKVYDPMGNVVAETSPEGRSQAATYDELGRLATRTEKIDATTSITTQHGYDQVGNRSRFVDGNKNVTIYTYNTLGKPESIIEPSTAAHPNAADRTWTSVYDAAAQPVKLTKPGGVVTTREYDAQGKLKIERGTGAEAATADRSFRYDKAGRVIVVSGPKGDSGYVYDDRGNLTQSYGAAGNAKYTYNGDSTVATREDASGTAAFTYDKAGRITTVVDPLSGRTVDLGYDAAGRTSLVADRSVSSWSNRRITYDELGRATSDQVEQQTEPGAPSSVLIGTEYGFDRDDKVTSKKVTSKSSTQANTYAYDGAGRLTQWTGPAGTTDYRWDAAGNRIGAGAATYAFDERNRLKSGGGATYSYTARGTLSSVTENGQTKNSAFDAFDRLATEGAASYAYDSLDRVTDRNGKKFQYLGLTNEAVSDGTRVISRLPDGRAFSDKNVSETAKGRMLFSDGRGDVIGRYLGAAVDGTRTFDPFGKVTASSGNVSPIGFQGDWTDADTGSVNMTARWYSPNAGQFVSRDDWTIDPNPSAAANRFQYGNNDPIGNTDPTGHLVFLAPLAAWGIAEVAAAIGAVAVTGVAVGGTIDTVNRYQDWRAEQNRRALSQATQSTVATVAGATAAETMARKLRAALEQLQRICWANCGTKPPCTGTCGNSNGGDTPPGAGGGWMPPPPPQWLVEALTAVPKLVAGSTVVVRAGVLAAATAATAVLEKVEEYAEERTKVTEDDDPNSPDSPNFDWSLENVLRAIGKTASELLQKRREDDDECVPSTDYKPMVGGRATGVEARLCPDRIPPGSPANKRIHPPGWPLRADGSSANPRSGPNRMGRSHLLANILGGSGNNPANLVTLYQDPVNNSPGMKRYELMVRSVVNGGEPVDYEVTPMYNNLQAMPTAVHMYARGDNGFCINVVIHNTKQHRVDHHACP
ncbi:DNRLRE domain-containing protein [Lentzea alba]|uniref:RHS repeat-associated core domain-containing protein n=1 Tax=Lentzea alba TaxID=2714351 RepID=UPI0039BFF89A